MQKKKTKKLKTWYWRSKLLRAYGLPENKRNYRIVMFKEKNNQYRFFELTKSWIEKCRTVEEREREGEEALKIQKGGKVLEEGRVRLQEIT